MLPNSDPRALKNIVIAGGGSAGWMAAIALAARFPEKHVTIVDSTTVGPIGVGESVTGVVLEFLSDPINRLTWGEFFRRCDATFKLGIWYKDWQGVGTEYLAPIDNPLQYFQFAFPLALEQFYGMAASNGIRLGEGQLYSHLMRSGKTDFCREPGLQIRNHVVANGLSQADAIAYFRGAAVGCLWRTFSTCEFLLSSAI